MCAVGLASTRNIAPVPGPFNPNGSQRFWGTPTMWGVLVGIIVAVVFSFSCYVVVRDRLKEARRFVHASVSMQHCRILPATPVLLCSRKSAAAIRQRLLEEGRVRDDSLFSINAGATASGTSDDGSDIR